LATVEIREFTSWALCHNGSSAEPRGKMPHKMIFVLGKPLFDSPHDQLNPRRNIFRRIIGQMVGPD
jgi:hypothetical protein